MVTGLIDTNFGLVKKQTADDFITLSLKPYIKEVKKAKDSFVNTMLYLFGKLGIPIETYNTSSKIIITDKNKKKKDFILFKRNTEKSTWFHFGTELKARSLKSFVKKVTEKLSEETDNSLYKRVGYEIACDLDNILKDILKENEIENQKMEKEYGVKYQPILKVKKYDTYYYINYYGILDVKVRKEESNITIRISDLFFDKHKSTFLKASEVIIKKLENYFGGELKLARIVKTKHTQLQIMNNIKNLPLVGAMDSELGDVISKMF